MGKKLIIKGADFTANAIVMEPSSTNNYNLPSEWFTYATSGTPSPSPDDGTGFNRLHIYIPIEDNQAVLSVKFSLSDFGYSVNSWAVEPPAVNDSGWLNTTTYQHTYQSQDEKSLNINFKKTNGQNFTEADVISVVKALEVSLTTGGKETVYSHGYTL